MRWLAIVVAVVTAACSIEPASPRVPVTLSADSVRLYIGQTVLLSVVGDARGIAWRSAAPGIATVNGAGFVTAIAPGIAAIWAVRAHDSASARVEATAPFSCAAGPTMAPPHATIAPGGTVEVVVRDGCMATGAGYVWRSGDTTVAVVAVREQGTGWSTAMVRGRAPGQVAIWANSIAEPATSGAIAITVGSSWRFWR
jgi:hypothetical protein